MRKIEIRPAADANLARDHKHFVGSAMFSADAWTQIAGSLGLSGRELQIVRGTFDDKTEMEIAADLDISPSTIHTHVERLHHKLAITDRAQLLLRVMQEFIALTAAPSSDLPPICAIRTARNCPLRP
jgi:DNA-binding CsgD family transcriptional regulator